MAWFTMGVTVSIFDTRKSPLISLGTVKNFTTEARRTQRGQGERRFYTSLSFPVLRFSVSPWSFSFFALQRALRGIFSSEVDELSCLSSSAYGMFYISIQTSLAGRAERRNCDEDFAFRFCSGNAGCDGFFC